MPPDKFDMFIAIGYQRLNNLRTDKFIAAKKLGYKLISYICSKSTVWPDLQIGENCFVMENNAINPFVTIEDNVIIWSGNLISHGSHISKNCFITSHVIIGGEVTVGENCFFGINSLIRDHIKVASNCIIGAGSIILRDTQENEAYVSEATKLSSIPFRMLKYVL
jgi:sugar O-acyltransferase (sialic acid O-acetyltransferase NeuD family)